MGISDFGDEHRTEDRADAGQLLNDAVTGMASQPVGDRRRQACLVGVEDIDQLEQ